MVKLMFFSAGLSDSVESFKRLTTWEASFAYKAAGLKITPLAGVEGRS